jgi:hypothetical protein
MEAATDHSKNSFDMDKSIVVDLLKNRLDAQQKLNEGVGRVCVLYLAVFGIILKYAFDEGVPVETRRLITIFGIAMALFGILTSVFADITRRRLDADVIELNEAAGRPLKHPANCGLRYTVIACIAFV